MVTKDVEYNTEGEIVILELFIVGAAAVVVLALTLTPPPIVLMLLAVTVKVQGPEPVTESWVPLVMVVGPGGAPALDEVQVYVTPIPTPPVQVRVTLLEAYELDSTNAVGIFTTPV